MGSRHFGYRDVPRYVVDRSVIARDRPAFVTQYTAPRAPAYIVQRGSRTYGYGNGNGNGRADNRGAVPRGLTGPGGSSSAGSVGSIGGSGNDGVHPGGGVAVPRTPDESPYDRAARVMGHRTQQQPDTAGDGNTHGGGAVASPGNNATLTRSGGTTHGSRGRGIPVRTAPPDGMSRDDQRDPGGNDGRSTVAPVLRTEGGIVRPPSGMSGPPGVSAPARGETRRRRGRRRRGAADAG